MINTILKKTHDNPLGMLIDRHTNTLYIGGTRWSNLQDVDADARDLLNNIDTSYKYGMAKNYIIKHKLKNVVGYSLGGSIADILTSNISQIKHARIYNSPSITRGHSDKRYVLYNAFDPIYGLFKNQKDQQSYSKVVNVVILWVDTN